MSAEKQQVQSVWTRPQRQRREQPALSRDQIVSVALELLDTEGLDALSMRKLGTRLNAGATSMYTYVANKDELFELVVDQVYGEIEVPAADDPADWRAATTRCAHSLRSTFLQHPWIVSVLGEVGVAYLGPNMMRLSDALLGVLEDGGFSLEAADRGVSTVFAYVIGVSTTEAAWLTTVKRSGRAEQDLMESLLPAAEQAVQGHPRLRRLYAAQRDADANGARDDGFEDGLQCVLDGLEARLGRGGGAG
ncbi:TetR/AcrR family transcriptional regulator [Streptomyces sp. NPDC008141]|uniref:TetR/AcrR family transcriptional regulator n=1 Tax=Streptomyces sp. NPDC008141 TaxID=3364815 RepID=UPI0036EC8D43